MVTECTDDFFFLFVLDFGFFLLTDSPQFANLIISLSDSESNFTGSMKDKERIRNGEVWMKFLSRCFHSCSFYLETSPSFGHGTFEPKIFILPRSVKRGMVQVSQHSPLVSMYEGHYNPSSIHFARSIVRLLLLSTELAISWVEWSLGPEIVPDHRQLWFTAIVARSCALRTADSALVNLVQRSAAHIDAVAWHSSAIDLLADCIPFDKVPLALISIHELLFCSFKPGKLVVEYFFETIFTEKKKRIEVVFRSWLKIF